MKIKMVCFRGVLERKNLESNLQGHTASVKEWRTHLAGIENSYAKWYDPEKKGFDWESSKKIPLTIFE